MKIYVVIGQTGEYSDRTEWLVKAYDNAEAAKQFIIRATVKANEIQTLSRKLDLMSYEIKDHFPNELDPKFEMDYTGTSYYFSEVELE